MLQALLDNPWPVGFALAVAGAIMVLHHVRLRQRAGVAGGALLLAAAVGVFILSATVTTPRQRIMQKTQALLDATAPLDSAALRSLLEPTVMLIGPDGKVWLEGRRLLDEMDGAISRVQIREHAVRDLVAQAEDHGTGFSFIDLRTTLESGGMGGQPIRSKWRLTWRRDAEGRWRVTEIQWQELHGTAPAEGMWR
jgi:ketosteroid isomerase-like protein